MENLRKKKSKYEYFLVFVLVLILAVFMSRIVHILQAGFQDCGASCPVTGIDNKK
jgi:hypothetical protein